MFELPSFVGCIVTPERSARGPGEAARRVRVAARGRGREGCPARRRIMDGHNRIGALMAKRQSAPTSAEWFTLPLWRAVPFGPRPETIGASPWRSPAAVQAGWAVILRGGRSRWALVVAFSTGLGLSRTCDMLSVSVPILWHVTVGTFAAVPLHSTLAAIPVSGMASGSRCGRLRQRRMRVICTRTDL